MAPACCGCSIDFPWLPHNPNLVERTRVGCSLRRHMAKIIRRETLARLADDYSLSALRASYAVDAAVFGPRTRVVQCSACDYRWSQRPHETCEADEGEGSPVASLWGGADDSLESSLQPIRETKPVRTETLVSEPPIAVTADAVPNTPSPTVSAISAGNVANSGALREVRDDLQEGGNLPSAQPTESPEGRQESADNAPTAEAAQPDGRFRRAFVAGMAALATITTLVAVLILLREPIVSALPDAAGPYGLIGLAPDPLGQGLEIRKVASARERVGGEDVLSVTGIVANVSGQHEPLPPCGSRSMTKPTRN
jgi:hypothetical protein